MTKCPFVTRNVFRAFSKFHCVSDMFFPSGFERSSISLKTTQKVNDFNV